MCLFKAGDSQMMMRVPGDASAAEGARHRSVAQVYTVTGIGVHGRRYSGNGSPRDRERSTSRLLLRFSGLKSKSGPSFYIKTWVWYLLLLLCSLHALNLSHSIIVKQVIRALVKYYVVPHLC